MTKTKFASSTGKVYEVYANRAHGTCTLRLVDAYGSISEAAVPACACEPGQDD